MSAMTPALILAEFAMIRALEAALPGKFFLQGDEIYEAFQKSFFAVQQGQLLPVCIFRPNSSQEVASFIKRFLAVGVCRLAIRGGGHSTLVGSSNINGGLTLDMRAMNHVELQGNGDIVSVGSGAVWGEVYTKLDPLNVSVVGGHGYDVGVAGFLLGGGISRFSPRYGFGCDMVENFEAVLANGDIVNANAEVNSDLWRTLKGGLNNLAIVTRFDLKVFQQPKIWGGCLLTPMTTLDESLAALVGFGDSWDPRVAVEQSVDFSVERGMTIINNLERTGSLEHWPDILLSPFMNVKPLYRNTMRLASLSNFAKENQQQLQSVGSRQMFCTTSFFLDLEHLKAVINVFQVLLPSVKDVPGMRWTLTYRLLHNDMPSKAAASGGNCTGFGNPSRAVVVCVLTSAWTDIAGDEQMRSYSEKFIEEVDALSKKADMFYPFKYLNYAAAFQDPSKGFAAGTKELLQAASRKYDPKGFFQGLVPGGSKLSA